MPRFDGFESAAARTAAAALAVSAFFIVAGNGQFDFFVWFFCIFRQVVDFDFSSFAHFATSWKTV
ncbi:hypothetical protein NEICINOT_03046 [Neisseria cinerea ATCC 14685]|uniref:Uncharacterized protein n=1 Tax=Neisseria cinerea ATCC 14685 TaxID=546262 RepID=D0W081_NEICI|nr:hypothetical protein NEICINOT_03046 [Neisseria cinerea ATCC 14685]